MTIIYCMKTCKKLKVAWWKKFLRIILKIQQNLNFLFLSLCVYQYTTSVYIFKNCPPRFQSHLELTESVFCREKLSFLPNIKPKQKLDSQFQQGKLKFCYMLRIIKMTQINFVSRNQLHNTTNSCQHLNFGLSWPGQG